MTTAFVRALAVIAGLSGLIVMAGYGLHETNLIVVRPGFTGMSGISALALTALSTTILLETLGRLGLAKVLALSAGVLALTVIASFLAVGSDVLSPGLSATLLGYHGAGAAQMSPATAVTILTLSIAAFSRDRPMFADLMNAAAFVIAGLAVIGYAYGVRELYAFSAFQTMAPQTAVAFTILSVASILVSDKGWGGDITAPNEGGAATRRQLGLLLLPPVAGGFLLKISEAQQVGPAIAMASLVVLTVIPLALLVLRDGRRLNLLDRERRGREVMLRERLDAQARALEHEAAERVKAEAAVARAQRMEAVGQLTGGIAHDFNNLLMAISGNLELARKRLTDDHPARRFADAAATATDKGSKLTGQLLAFSRTQKMRLEPFALDEALQRARDLVGNSLGPSIEVKIQLGATGLYTLSDADQLDLAILNLAINARDAMPDGGVLRIESGRLDESHRAFVRVSDTGEGMSAEVVAKAVEPFFTTKPSGKGTGLGLAQVYAFVRQSDGELKIESRPGAGTTIELLLPLIERPVDARPRRRPPSAFRDG